MSHCIHALFKTLADAFFCRQTGLKSRVHRGDFKNGVFEHSRKNNENSKKNIKR